jgi:ribosomal protein L3 glutamine methyltransferase
MRVLELDPGINPRISSPPNQAIARVTEKTLDKLARDLITVRDVFRYAVSHFRSADLSYGHGTGNAVDEAAFLILESLHLPIDDLNPFADARLTLDERRLLLTRIHDRVRTRKPASYIVNRAYVHGMSFYIDERAIVPRSFIAELLLSGRLGRQGWGLLSEPEKITSVLDLCTGSGCLAVIAALLCPRAKIHATDLSAGALAVARINVEQSPHQDRITLFEGDLFQPVGHNRYDLIVANPPYVAAAAMAALPAEYRHEPELSLAGGSDGLDVVTKILAEAKRHLNPSGLLICEIGQGREALESHYPDTEFLWLDTEESSGEVFCLTCASAPAMAKR